MTGRVIDFNNARRLRPRPSPAEATRRLETLRVTLRSRAADLVREIFPAAVVKSGVARIGDVTGAPGESMAIHLSGEKAGLWFDHGDSRGRKDGGDLITLWALTYGYETEGPEFWLGVEDLEDHLGLTQGSKGLGRVAQVAKARASVPKVEAPTKVSELTYVYTSSDGGSVLAQVVRRQMSDGSKTFLQRNAAGEWKSPEVRPLYRLPNVLGAPVVVLAEGEKCADALEEHGVVATTAMGGSKAPLDKTDWTPLAGKRVILWPDNDEPGRDYMARVEPVLRALGCRVATVAIPAGQPPKWDAADALEAERGDLVREALDQASTRLDDAAVAAGQRFLPRSFEGVVPPPRPWAYGNILMYGAVTGVAAPPGVGKTTFSVQLGVAFGLDRAFGPWTPAMGGGGKVWLYNGEEPREELDRRFIASCREMQVDEATAARRVFYNSGLEERLTFVRQDPRTGELVRSPDVDIIKHAILEHDFKLFIIDPLIEFHAAKEDTEGFHAIGAVLREIANDCECAVLFFHHTPKSANSDTAAGDMNAMRGGGPIVGVARFVATMFGMTAKDAERYGVPASERTRYVRFDDAKANMTVVDGEPQWWVKRGQGIDNASEVRPADSIGVLRFVNLKGAGEETERQRASQADAALHRIAEEMARVCRDNGHTSAEMAASLDAICKGLDPVRTGARATRVKELVTSKLGPGVAVEGGRIVIETIPRGNLTLRRVYLEEGAG